MDSSLLLLPLNKAENAMGRIPGKLFEQMRSKVPILCLGPGGSDVENIITETKTGQSFEYSDYERIKRYVLNLFQYFIENKPYPKPESLEVYSIENQVEKLAGYLNEIIET